MNIIYLLVSIMLMGIGIYFIFRADADRRANELTKTDLVFLMQILHRAEANTKIGHDNHKHFPRVIRKIDKMLLKMIEDEKSTVHHSDDTAPHGG